MQNAEILRAVPACIARRRWAMASAIVAAAVYSPLVKAANFTWSGQDGAASSNWTDSNNWAALAAPDNNGTANIFFAPVPVVTTAIPTVNVPYSIQSLTFSAGSPNYTIAGNSTLTIGSGGITSGSLTLPTIAAPVSLSVAQTWNSLDSLTVTGVVAGTGPLTITGTRTGAVTLTGSNTYTGGTILTSGILAISGTAGADSALGDASGNVTFNGGTLQVFGPPAGITSRTFAFKAGGGTLKIDSDFFLSGPITGTGTLAKTGNADLSVLGDNGSTFTGPVDLQRGTTTLYAYGDQPLGTGSVTLRGGSNVSLADQLSGSTASPSTTVERLASAGTFTYGAGGGILAPTDATTDGGSIFNTQLGGSIDGTTSNLLRTNRGTLIIAPSNGTAATSLGVLEKITVTGSGGNLPGVTNGIVSATIVGQNNDGAFTGDFLNYNTSGFVSAAGYYSAGFTGQIANVTTAATVVTNTSAYAARINNAAITISPAATLTIGDGTAAHAAGLILNGASPAIAGGTLAFAASEGSIYTAKAATISSTVTGSNGLTAFGPGTLTLSGGALYTGATTINGVYEPATGAAGTLLLSTTGSITGGGAIAVNPYATFADRGNVTGGGTVTVDGTLTGDGKIAGPVTVDSAAIIAPGFGTFPASLSTGNISLTSGAKATFGLSGITSEELNVTGSVTLGGATLDVEPLSAASIVAGTTYVLVANDGTDAVSGTFLNLPQGSLFTAADGVRFTISYTGDSATGTFSGAGNDVVLVAGAVPEPASIGIVAIAGGMLSIRRRRKIILS